MTTPDPQPIYKNKVVSFLQDGTTLSEMISNLVNSQMNEFFY